MSVRHLLFLAGLALPCASAHASLVRVPDDVPTIVAALATAADTISVRPGTYPDSLRIARSVVLSGVPAAEDSTALPTTGAITIVVERGVRRVTVRGLHVAGSVRQWNDDWDAITTLERCRIDSGVRTMGDGYRVTVRLHRCRIFGGVGIGADESEIADCHVVGGISAGGRQHVYLRRNTIEGPALQGVSAGGGWGLIAEHNVVSGAVDGFRISGPATLDDNRVVDCTGTAFRTWSVVSLRLRRNVVLHCGAGFDVDVLPSFSYIEDNRVSDVAGHGLHVRFSATSARITGNRLERVGGRGIWLERGTAFVMGNTVLRPGDAGIVIEDRGVCMGNTVLHSGDAGIVLDDAGVCDSNVVGRSAGDGIRIGASEDLVLSRYTQNTSYANGGAGFRIDGHSGDTLSFNIAYGNAGVGIEWLGYYPPLAYARCNDWFGNQAGNTIGLSPDATDVSVDPLFCSVAEDDVRLNADSPLLRAPRCRRIGALGVGCGTTPTRLLLFEVERDVRGVRIRWQLSAALAGAEVWVESAPNPAGPWRPIASERREEGGIVTEVDLEALPDVRTWYRLIAREDGRAAPIGGPITAVEHEARFALERITPNPVSDAFRVGFVVVHRSTIVIDMFDVQGRKVASLAGGEWGAGRHAIEWPGQESRDVAPGVYVLRYRHPEGVELQRLVLTR